MYSEDHWSTIGYVSVFAPDVMLDEVIKIHVFHLKGFCDNELSK